MNSHTSADPEAQLPRPPHPGCGGPQLPASGLDLDSVGPLHHFAVLTAVLTYVLGVYRYEDLGSTREQITAGERPTLSAVLDAAQAWGTAAEAIGSTATSTGYMLWLLIALAVINAASVPLLWAVTRESGITPRWGFPAVVFDAMKLVVRFIIACGFVAWSAGLPTILFSVQLWPQLAGSLVVGYLPVWMIRRDAVERILLRPRLVLTSPPHGPGAGQ